MSPHALDMIVTTRLFGDVIRSSGEPNTAGRIRRAARAAIADHDRITPDRGGNANTDGFTQAAVERLGHQTL